MMKNIQSSDEIRITRRSVLCGALVMAAVTAARTVLAEQMQNYLPPGKTAKPKGPLVFLDYDKDEIDFAYDQAPWAPNAREVSKRNAQKSTAALARLGPPRRLAYGPTDIEKLDIYTTKRPNAPINVFLHGGAWRSGNAKGAAYMSETFVDAGAHFISLDFNNAPEVDGNLMIIAKCGALSPGFIRMRRASAATPIGSTSRALHPAVILPLLHSRPTGRRILDYRLTR